MIGCRYDDDIAREMVELHQQERDDALDLAGLVNVAALLPDGVELVEEEDAGRRADIFEEARKTSVGFAEIGTDERIIAHGEERDSDRLGNGFGDRGLAIARRPREEDAMARLHSLGAEQIGAMLLLDELARQLFGRKGEDELVEPHARLGLDDEIATRHGRAAKLTRARHRHR